MINILSNYKFTITENTPIEEEIALDPELLGKVFENLLASYNPETKTTARKQTGSFYTPREIVNFMVDESLIAYLKAKLQTETQGFRGFVAFGENQPTMFGNEGRKQLAFEMPISNNRWHGKDEELEIALRDLFSYSEEQHKFNETETEILIKAIDNCKILDPACGSGAFPMGALLKLVHILEKLDQDNAKWREWQRLKAEEDLKRATKIEDKQERASRLIEINDIFDLNSSDYGRKLFLIENCIYGVDIQPIAIQIAKLRFFISLIVDQRSNKEKENLGIRPLPNLETKFVAANTLIGLEASEQQDLFRDKKVDDFEQKLRDIRSLNFRADKRHKKLNYQAQDKEIREQLADHLKQHGNFSPEDSLHLANWDIYDQTAKADWFDPKWMFGIEKGFDIVIGNPPYVQLQKIKEEADKFQKAGYETFSRTGDIYCIFYELGSRILAPNGILSYITSNKWMRAAYGQALRKYFSENTNPLILIDFGGLQVFDAATVDTNILVTQKAKDKNKTLTCVINSQLSNLSLLSDYFRQNATETTNFNLESSWVVLSSIEQNIKTKIEKAGMPLKEWDINIYRGILTGYNEAFIIDTATREKLINSSPKSAEIIRPILRGRDVQKYKADWKGLYIIATFPSLNLNIDDYPAVKKHLLSFGFDRLKQTGEKGARKKTKNEWFEVQDSINYWEDFLKPKIVWGEISDRSKFAYNDTNYYTEATTFLMTGKDLKYLLALLNSRVSEWYFNQIGTATGVGTNRWKKYKIELLPIKIPSETTRLKVEDIINRIFKFRNEDIAKDTAFLEDEIDELIYQIYDLSPEEIQYLKSFQ